MRSLLALALVPLSAALAQQPPKESDTLRELLAEVRQLRQAVESMTAASQRVQIALHSLQAQEGTVARAAQRVDELRTRRLGLESGVTRIADDVRRFEEAVAQAPNDILRKELQTRLQEIKANSDRSTIELQKLQGLEAEASSELRTEQAKLSEIQSRLDKLDQALAR